MPIWCQLWLFFVWWAACVFQTRQRCRWRHFHVQYETLRRLLCLQLSSPASVSLSRQRSRRMKRCLRWQWHLHYVCNQRAALTRCSIYCVEATRCRWFVWVAIPKEKNVVVFFFPFSLFSSKHLLLNFPKDDKRWRRSISHNDRIAPARFSAGKPVGPNEKLLPSWKYEKAIFQIAGGPRFQRARWKPYPKSWEYHITDMHGEEMTKERERLLFVPP